MLFIDIDYKIEICLYLIFFFLLLECKFYIICMAHEFLFQNACNDILAFAHAIIICMLLISAIFR